MTKKRVRTGCLRCRTRRRKCDEGKPRCQRCINGGSECRYGTRLSFLPKNSLSVEQEPRSRTTSSYGAIKFVVPKSSRREQVPSTPTQQDEGPAAHDVGDDGAGNESPGVDGSPLDIVRMMHSSPLGNDPPSSSPSGEMTSGRYHDALDALLSLRAEEVPTILDLPPDALFQAPNKTNHAEGGTDDLFLTSRIPPHSLSLGGSSEEQALALMKHWRYQVAPWLDICDLGHGFGIYVSRLAAFAKPVLEAVLSLSAASLPHTSDLAHPPFPVPETPGDSNLQDAGTDCADSSPPVMFLTAALTQARRLFVTQQVDEFLLLRKQYDVSQHSIGEPTTAVGVLGCHLQLRLELSRALLDEQALSAVPSLEFCSTSWHKSQLARDMFLCATKPLIHCAQTVQFCYIKVPCVGTIPGNRVSKWLVLLEDLDMWYSARPSEFHSIFEVDNSDDGIPTILFTSGAATFANQLYHTAMLLLLLHKPRTAQVPRRQRRVSAVSPLWHVRRICGMSLNNDLRSTWDPSLLSSFIIASKRMTHESQHRTILQGLDKISGITGWDTAEGKQILQSEWGTSP